MLLVCGVKKTCTGSGVSNLPHRGGVHMGCLHLPHATVPFKTL